jgi:hypothetical protein
MKRLLLVLFGIMAFTAIYGQTKFPLTVICSENDADLYINNKLYTKTIPNLKVQLPPAVYNIKIAKAGFNEFNANVTVKATSTGNVLSVQLQPLQAAPAQIQAPNPFVQMFPLNVAANAPGAQVYLNSQYAGNAPFGQNVLKGNYEVRVTAPGYNDFVQRITVNGPSQVNAILQSAASMLSISANVNGAEVIINGNPAGRTPFSAQVPNGSYNVLVRAAGYSDYQAQIVVSGQQAINAVLQSLAATWQLQLPEGIKNRDVKSGQSTSVQIWIDGVFQGESFGPQIAAGQFLPGRHTIRMVSGGLAAETQFEAQAGRAYTIEPSLILSIK